MRLQNSVVEEEPDLSLIDDDPLTYFLTPPPSGDDNSLGDDDAVLMDFDFDAGIEDAKHPAQIMRSISPSSLEGLSLPPPRPPTPPRSPPARLSPDLESATDDDDDNEEYIHYGTGRFHTLLKDFAALKTRKTAKTKAAGAESLQPAVATLGYGPASSLRGRPTARLAGPRHGGPRGRPRTFPARRRSPHAWREPSPDVWSIEEETEEELNSEMGSSMSAEDMASRRKADEENKRMNINPSAAKPKKKVRFVLPAKET